MIIGTISLFSKFFTELGALAADIIENMGEFESNFDEYRCQLTNERYIKLKRRIIEIIKLHVVSKTLVARTSVQLSLEM